MTATWNAKELLDAVRAAATTNGRRVPGPEDRRPPARLRRVGEGHVHADERDGPLLGTDIP